MPDTLHPSYITTEAANDLVVDLVAAAYGALSLRGHESAAEKYADFVNRVLREHRVSYKFVGAELVPFESDELFVAVVEPALLVTSEHQRAHDAYLDALRQIRGRLTPIEYETTMTTTADQAA